jgi:hypothetical protein
MRSRSFGATALALTLALTSAWARPAAGEQTFGPVTLGADLRLREVYIGNIGFNEDSPTANRVFQRYRLRGWGQYAFNEHVAANARVIWEGRHYSLPPESAWPVPGFERWYSGGVLLDGLSLDLKRIGDSPLSVKAGRQDIRLGDGWLVMDGTPIDGSRTFYLDAARATYAFESAKTTLDLIYIDQHADTDGFPRPLNGDIEDQTEQFETGAILYARNKSLLKDTDLDGYFIYKGNDPNDTPANIRVNNGTPFPSPADDGEVYALGARIDSRLGGNWTLKAETAREWGTNSPYPGAPHQDISAFGLNTRLGYAFNDPLANRLHLDLEYLSGDDPKTANNEAFDPLWGRWPQWSELYIYQWPLDSRVGQATNLLRLNLGWAAKVHPTTEVSLDYHALWANQESVRTPSQLANISQDGTFRGHLFTAWAKAKFNKHLSGHLVAEYLAPGDFYAESRRDGSYFLRAELVLAY